MMITFNLMIPFLCIFLPNLLAIATPTNRLQEAVLFKRELQQRTVPFFPDTPASCPICAQNYDGINSCAAAAPLLTNFTNVIFNPGAFIDVIKCACTDTFQSAYPQCVDCFTQTNQTQVLNYDTANLPSLVGNIRKICSLESSLLGNVSETNGEVTPVASSPASTPTGAASRNTAWGGGITLALIALSVGLESCL
ncbi:hypothetical protein DXG01_011103 [Tephrocybe rancida]|nr:hypothetical protein DXG01_011103 [Tephrocybe rancida]